MKDNTKRENIASWLCLFACNLMWALQFTCIKLVQNQVGPLSTVWIPTLLSVLMLYPFVRLERRSHSPSVALPTTHLIRTYLLLVLIGVAPGQLLMTWGTRLSLASNAAMITLTLPVTTALFAVLFLKERMTIIRWISFGLAILGVVLASGSTLHDVQFSVGQPFGNSLVFLATLGSSFYNSYGKKALAVHGPIEMLYWTYMLLALCMAPFVILFEKTSLLHIPAFTLQTWTGIALLTIFHTYLSMVLFLTALKRLDAIQAALSNYLIALFGIPIAAIVLKEKLSPATIVGGILVLSSTILMAGRDQPQASEAHPM